MKKSAKLMIAMLLVVLLVFTLVACGDKGGTGGTGGTGAPDTNCTIIFESNGGSAVANMVVDRKSEITLPTTTKEGYTFAGWFADYGTLKTPFDIAYIKANPNFTSITAYAKWTANQYTLTFDSNGGSEVLPLTQDYDTSIAPPTEPKKACFKFEGWYKDRDFATIFDFETEILTKDITLFAKWSSLLVFEATTDGGVALKTYSGDEESVVIPSTYNDKPVTSIQQGAFSYCQSLKSITIPASVTSLKTGAFYYCQNLESITIPASVTSLTNKSFTGCIGLASIVIDAGNTVYSGVGNCLIEKATNTLIFGCKTSVIPNSVTKIGEEAFYECANLKSITIPDSVTSIGARAFSSCSLKSITIPASVTSIGKGAFYGCSNLQSITVPFVGNTLGGTTNTDFGYIFDGVPASLKTVVITGGTSIKDSAFSFCSKLTSITIPDSVTSIGQYAFNECSGLTSITIGSGVESIGREAFQKCSSLTGVTIPNSVISIGESAFYYCTGLTSVTIGSSVKSIGNDAFIGCSGLTSIVIPASVTSIGGGAFSGCSGLKSIIIPNSVTSIGSYAFSNCSSLATINCEAASQPNNWKSDWNGSCNATVVWGYKGI